MSSIEWFISVLSHNDIFDHKKLSSNKKLYDLYQRLKEQAKEMHKQELFEYWQGGINCTEVGGKSFDQYYQEIFVSPTYTGEYPFKKLDVRQDALQFLSTQAQELNLGYEAKVPKQETLYTEEQVREELIGFQIYLNNKGLITNHDWDFEKEAKKYIKSLKQLKKDDEHTISNRNTK